MEMDKEKERERRRERGDRPPRTESEERRRRQRRKEREERYKREGRDPKSGSRTKAQRNLDLIDKLDVTGIYGEGCKFVQKLVFIASQLTKPLQYSTTTVHSMRATHTETQRRTERPQCTLFLKAQQT